MSRGRSEDQSHVHLALTGQREAWPPQTPFWLLAPYSSPGARPGDPAALQGIIEYPWSDRRALLGAQAEARRLRHAVLEPLSKHLNALHGTEHATRYWEVLIGPWLFFFTNLVYQHHQSLVAARGRLGEVEAIGLHEANFSVPCDTLRFIYAATDDTYNLQLATRICAQIGIPIATRIRLDGAGPCSVGQSPENLRHSRPSLLQRVRYQLLRLSRSSLERMVGHHAPVVLRRSYLPGKFEAKLAVASGGRVLPVDPPLFPPSALATPDAGMRAALRSDSDGDELERLLLELIPEELPTVFVEDYRTLSEFAERHYGRFRPEVVVSVIAWRTDEAFKHFGATAAEAGALLVGGQHGGTGVLRDHHVEEFEREVLDRYLTWGWDEPGDPHCIPTPAARVVDLPRREPGSIHGNILFTGTVALRYPITIQGDFSGYPTFQRRFFEALKLELMSQLEVRLHPTDFGWRIAERLKASFPDLAMQDWRVPFSDALRRARLYVCDHLSTTYTQALATNTPTVMFWDRRSQNIRDSEEFLFERLRSCGIVHDTPESAAAWVEEVYPDVESWWFSDECQSSVQTFCHRHARVSETPVQDWLDVLETVRISRQAETKSGDPRTVPEDA